MAATGLQKCRNEMPEGNGMQICLIHRELTNCKMPRFHRLLVLGMMLAWAAGSGELIADEPEDPGAGPSVSASLIQYVTGRNPESTVLKHLEIEPLDDGSSGREMMQEAIRGLPMKLVTDRNRQRINDLLRTRTLYRKLPTVKLRVERGVYEYFTANPDAAVSLWRVMEISKFRMRRTSPSIWEADSGDGSTGTIEILYRTPNEALVLCDGLFQPSLPIKPIAAQALLHLETIFRTNAEGEPEVIHRCNLFVSFPSQPVKVAARLISPVSNSIMDKNFVEISRFLRLMTYGMQQRPGWVESLGRGMQDVRPECREEFLQLAARVYVRARKRNLQNSMQSQPVTLQRVMPPGSKDGTGAAPAELPIDRSARPIPTATPPAAPPVSQP